MLRLKLQKLCNENIILSYPLHSRVHRMKEEYLFVKREDELGFGISGSKLRKYVSILLAIKNQNKKVALVGSLYSNHILSFLQILKQEKIPYQLFLEKSKSKDLKGNAFFLSLLIKEGEVIWIDKAPEILDETWKNQWNESYFWIPVGGCMEEALVGSLTLALDVVKNEEELLVFFKHIFIDAGTGMSAIGLILGLSYLRREINVHVVLVAGKEIKFIEKLTQFHNQFQALVQESFSIVPYRCLLPVTAKSFGSHNASIFNVIKQTAEEEGLFLDPIYNAKLLLTAKKVTEEESLTGNILWIHSGGALSLSGFQESRLQS
jgi:1-aminocyclopropane-1-carboxylate deaminase